VCSAVRINVETPAALIQTQNDVKADQFLVVTEPVPTNYFMVDGVSANFGSARLVAGQTMGGAIPGFTSGGGTSGLVSVDAMQEFRIRPLRMRRNSDAPPGRRSQVQISIVTKSAANQFHGTCSAICGTCFRCRKLF
jgi:hypothetical protein